jgi:hypothetical protein
MIFVNSGFRKNDYQLDMIPSNRDLITLDKKAGHLTKYLILSKLRSGILDLRTQRPCPS